MRSCKDSPPDKRPFVKRSIDESAYCVEFLYLRVCHQGHSAVSLDEILVRRVLFAPETRRGLVLDKKLSGQMFCSVAVVSSLFKARNSTQNISRCWLNFVSRV